jgi:hypothetical protein
MGTRFLGIAFLVLMTVVVLNSLSTEGPGSRGVPEGDRMPAFAAPLAVGGPDADANVATRPDSGSEGAQPACDVRGEGILNVCELWERGPVALAFFATRSQSCLEQVDALDRADTGGVQVAAVAIRGERSEVQRIVRERGWELPVGWDRDGAVSNLYAVAVCPTITFAREGGDVVETSLELLEGDALQERLTALRG